MSWSRINQFGKRVQKWWAFKISDACTNVRVVVLFLYKFFERKYPIIDSLLTYLKMYKIRTFKLLNRLISFMYSNCISEVQRNYMRIQFTFNMSHLRIMLLFWSRLGQGIQVIALCDCDLDIYYYWKKKESFLSPSELSTFTLRQINGYDINEFAECYKVYADHIHTHITIGK